MIKITLPNGAVKEFEAASVTGKQVAEAIRKELGASIPEEAITLLPEAIKKLGEFRAEIVLQGVSAELAVIVSKL